jgi:predicted Zn-dependent protease
MPIDRTEALKTILARNPGDPLARYGLAMEYVKAGRFEEAVAEFRTLVAATPDHSYAYFHGAQTLEKLNRPDEARAMYGDGIEAARRKGDTHARGELEAALEQLAGGGT